METGETSEKTVLYQGKPPPRARPSQALSSCMASQSTPRSCFPQQLPRMFPHQPWPTASQQQATPKSFQVPEPPSLDPTMSSSSTHPMATGDQSTVAPTHSDSCLGQRSKGQHAFHTTMGVFHTTTMNLPLLPWAPWHGCPLHPPKQTTPLSPGRCIPLAWRVLLWRGGQRAKCQLPAEASAGRAGAGTYALQRLAPIRALYMLNFSLGPPRNAYQWQQGSCLLQIQNRATAIPHSTFYTDL